MGSETTNNCKCDAAYTHCDEYKSEKSTRAGNDNGYHNRVTKN